MFFSELRSINCFLHSSFYALLELLYVFLSVIKLPISKTSHLAGSCLSLSWLQLEIWWIRLNCLLWGWFSTLSNVWIGLSRCIIVIKTGLQQDGALAVWPSGNQFSNLRKRCLQMRLKCPQNSVYCNHSVKVNPQSRLGSGSLSPVGFYFSNSSPK